MSIDRIFNAQDLVAAMNSRGIHRIPNHVYQHFYTIAQGNYSTDVAQKMIRHQLKAYVDSVWPGKVVVNTIDLSGVEARKIHPDLPWGMYVQLDVGDYAEDIGTTIKQLGNG